MPEVRVTTYDGTTIEADSVESRITTYDGGPGPQGPAGPGVSTGTGAPVGDGEDGELYVDVATGDLYRWTS